MPLVRNDSIDTLRTDGKNLEYSPEFVKETPMPQLIGALGHDVMHPALQHHLRSRGKDHTLWNEACDYVINPIIMEAGMELPANCLMDTRFDGMSAEQVYDKLSADRQKGIGKVKTDEQDNNQTNEGDEGDEGGDKKDKSFPGNCGEFTEPQAETGGQASQAELDKEANEWNMKIVNAAQQAGKLAGDLPGGISRLVDNILNPKIDWKHLLADFVDEHAKNDYSWMKPNHRYISYGLYLPSLDEPEIGEVVVAIDTSGSVEEKELAQFLSEVSAIMEGYDTKTTVLYVDHKVHRVEEYTRDDLPIKPQPTGGGGTSFTPPFKWCDDNGVCPSVMLYFTDGYADEFPIEPEFPVLWIYTRNNPEPPFGLSVNI